jgi:branched-chain amino acid transport system substrate-binding protein
MKMKEKEKSRGGGGISRREFIKKAGVTGAALGAAAVVPSLGRKAFAAKRDHILIGHPSSLTGPLAGLGEPTSWVNKRVLEAINKEGGIYIKEYGKKVPVKVKILDMESNPTKASEVASKLILQDKIDLMLVMYTPDVVNPVSAVCERFQMPCVSLGVPIEAWLTGGPYKWSYLAFFTFDRWTDIYIDIWDQMADKTNKVVGALFPNDPDGVTVAPMFNRKLIAKGYRFIDPGRFPYFTPDYSAQINLFKKEKVEILTGALIAPDWATAWKQCHRLGFIPKIVTMGKALLFPSALEAMGSDIGHGLTMEVWWSRYHPFEFSMTGESAEDLCAAWEKETGKQWTPSIGFKHAGYELVFDVIKRAQTLDKEALREAIDKTDLDTIVGHIKFNEKHYAETPLVGGQWVKGKKWPFEIEIVHNGSHPEIPNTAKMIFPLPK